MRTAGAGASGCPAVMLPGCTSTAMARGGPATTAKGSVDAGKTPSARAKKARAYPVPDRFTARSVKAATPSRAAAAVVPRRVPAGGAGEQSRRAKMVSSLAYTGPYRPMNLPPPASAGVGGLGGREPTGGGTATATAQPPSQRHHRHTGGIGDPAANATISGAATNNNTTTFSSATTNTEAAAATTATATTATAAIQQTAVD
jgi:hypothetical protein